MAKKTRRPQAPKHIAGPRNEEFALATRTRHAASARPVPSGTAYRRGRKHRKFDWGEGQDR